MRTLLTLNTPVGRRSPAVRPHHQHGAALVLSLVFLLILTLLGITAVSTSTLQEKMAGNMKNQNVALQATEAALRDGELRLRNLVDASILAIGAQPAPNNTKDGIYSTGTVDALNDPWWQANSTLYANDTDIQITQAVEDPRSVIENLGTNKDSLDAPTKFEETSGMTYYRIWARGVGGTANAQSTLQSTYKIPGP